MSVSPGKFDAVYVIDDNTPSYTELRGIYKKSFAYYTLNNRLPCTLRALIVTLQSENILSELIENEREELNGIVCKIKHLLETLERDGTLDYFDGQVEDKDVWNRFLNEIPMGKRTFYQNSKWLQNFDYFRSQKAISLENAKTTIEQIVSSLKTRDDIEFFAQILRLCLWSNRCDLSITSGKSVKPIDNLLESVRKLDSYILVDDTFKVWRCLESVPKGTAIIDFICDNSAFELFTDLLLGDYFLQHQFAAKVRFHIKAIPWFISDTISSDVDSLLDMLCSNPEGSALHKLGSSWRKYLQNGDFELFAKSRFWTSPFEYCKMPLVDNELHNCLSQAQLLIFKGDLNYRKLLGDFNWAFTDDFQKTLRGFAPSNLVALRTVKGDLISGLPEGLAEKTKIINPDWMTTGEYGVIQFADR